MPSMDWGEWRYHLLLTLAIIGTVLGGLFLALADNWQARLAPHPTVDPLAALDSSLLPTLPLPTPIPVTPSPTLIVLGRGKSTPVPVLPKCGVVPAGWVAYTVQDEEFLTDLGLDSGATISEMMQANCLDTMAIYSGMILYLPATPPLRVVCGPPLHWVQYVVRPGDTLSALARALNSTVYALLNGNCLETPTIYAGQILYLPQVIGPPSPVPLPSPTPTALKPTPQPSLTMTPAGSPSPVATETASPVATETPSPLPTLTPTEPAVPTETPTPSPTDTVTPLPTDTLEPTATETAPPPTEIPPTATEPPSPEPSATPG